MRHYLRCKVGPAPRFSGFAIATVVMSASAICVAARVDTTLTGEILAETGVEGGLVVHLECGNGRLTAALRANDKYIVQGLDRDAGDIKRAREYIASRGLYGPVSVQLWTAGYLPYRDNLVNLFVSDKDPEVPEEEIMRVLCPGGVAYTKRDGKWAKTVKPWPDDIDQWTHYLHGSDNNATAMDARIAPPRHIQWKARPMWCRSHEYNSSLAAAVSANGRVFYIIDNGEIGLEDERLPVRWSLVARDAFNGVKLWERPMSEWGPDAWGNVGFRSNPHVLPRRLVAVGDHVFATLSYDGPLVRLEAATGELLREYEGTDNTYEILSVDGVVLLRIRRMPEGDPKRRAWEDADEIVMALNAETGEVLWRHKAPAIVPLTLCADSGRVCYHDYDALICRDLETGEQLWRAESKAVSENRSPAAGRWHKSNIEAVMIYKSTVFYTAPKGLEAYALNTGEKLWTGPPDPPLAPTQPSELFGARGLVWPTGVAGRLKGTSVNMKGYDPKTGEMVKEISVSHLVSPEHHVRCYRSKATGRYLLLPKRGVEFLDLAGKDHMRHDWLRAPCSYGVMPCNGLLYIPPSQCFCYPGVKLSGFNTLSAGVDDGRPEQESAGDDRLERGPAWNAETGDAGTHGAADDWPTYRHDPLRSGATNSSLRAQLERAWQTRLGGKISPPVVAGGRLYVADKDAHAVLCLDAADGTEQWRFTADGRIDSPPTIYGDRVLFGSTDGHVYCLRASDGGLIWRFRAAPKHRRVVAFGQLESAWPVHGSVLVQDGTAYFSAGRSSYLDGGIDVFGIDPATGEVLHQAHLESDRPDVFADTGRPFDMEGARSDVLVSDGTDLYMFQVRLNPDLTQQEAPRLTSLGDRKMGLHLITTKGFLDDTWFNRTYWMYSRRWPGFYFAQHAPKSGQILVFDDTTTYGVHVFRRRERWSPVFKPGAMQYELFADKNSNEPKLLDSPVDKVLSREELGELPESRWKSAVGVEKGAGFVRTEPPVWSNEIPVRVKAMVLAGNRLYVAGPPGADAEADPLAAFEPGKGAQLWAVDAADGGRVARYDLAHEPAFDGMIAADGRLYIVTTDGHLICMS